MAGCHAVNGRGERGGVPQQNPVTDCAVHGARDNDAIVGRVGGVRIPYIDAGRRHHVGIVAHHGDGTERGVRILQAGNPFYDGIVLYGWKSRPGLEGVNDNAVGILDFYVNYGSLEEQGRDAAILAASYGVFRFSVDRAVKGVDVCKRVGIMQINGNRAARKGAPRVVKKLILSERKFHFTASPCLP